jgi:hypothetical protein
MRELTFDEYGMVIKGLDEHAKTLFRLADGRKYAGRDFTEKRHELRRLARKYTALAREFETELVATWQS